MNVYLCKFKLQVLLGKLMVDKQTKYIFNIRSSNLTSKIWCQRHVCQSIVWVERVEEALRPVPTDSLPAIFWVTNNTNCFVPHQSQQYRARSTGGIARLMIHWNRRCGAARVSWM